MGQGAAFESGHVEQQVGVVLGIDADEGILPLDGQSVLDVPENGTAEVDVVLHQTNASVTRPSFLVVVADGVLVVGVGMLRQVALDQVASFFGREPEVHVDAIDVTRIEWDRW